MKDCRPSIITWMCCLALAAVEPTEVKVAIGAPLTTYVRCDVPASAARLRATVTVSEDAPHDLGVAGWVSDRGGHWYQTTPRALAPGIHHLDWSLAGSANLQAIGHGARWSAAESAKLVRGGLVLWSAQRSTSTVVVTGLRGEGSAKPTKPSPRLIDLQSAAWDPQGSGFSGTTGERWEVSVNPLPFPANPYDEHEFILDALITGPDGIERRIPGFFAQDMRRVDRGDNEAVIPVPGGSFRVRYRPQRSGEHQIRMVARWAGGPEVSMALPPLRVQGQPWDGYVRIDQKDRRFFSVDGGFYWPLGPNLRSVWDVRGQQDTGTRLTPDRGTLAYDAYLDRFGSVGATACEIWLTSWNLGLEWCVDWPGFHGAGRFNEENAWRLDHILDRAWRNGMRVNLVVNHHGQASEHVDSEWANHPWSRLRGGPIARASQLFTDPRALAGQERVRRYLVARYADHPAVLGWKLWTEQDLTDGRGALPAWHEQATARWRALDTYHHPLTSHWNNDYTCVVPEVAQHLDYVCLDGYHGCGEDYLYRDIAKLMQDSTWDPKRGQTRFAMPVLVTEFGGSGNGAVSDAILEIDHAIGPWAAFMTGHAGSPMLWWFEWIDQSERWGPYRALSAFIAGEDLRGAGVSVALPGSPLYANEKLQCLGWKRPGRLLGHLVDHKWARTGGAGRLVKGAEVWIGDAVNAGTMVVEWWNADTGKLLARESITHAGGKLALTAPDFHRHIAFKLIRDKS